MLAPVELPARYSPSYGGRTVVTTGHEARRGFSYRPICSVGMRWKPSCHAGKAAGSQSSRPTGDWGGLVIQRHMWDGDCVSERRWRAMLAGGEVSLPHG